MTAGLVVVVPVLDRPWAASRLADSLAEATTVEYSLLFVCTPGDREQIRACEATGADVLVVDWPCGDGDYARKINYGYRATEEPYILQGADDLRFWPGWDLAVLEVAEGLGAGVVGTNDLHNPLVQRGLHSTHSLVRRSYADEQGTVDEVGAILHEGYSHQFVDTELVGTAQMRGEWAFAKDAHVEHLHPIWNGGVKDATYQKALAGTRQDRVLFRRRQRLWRHRRRTAGRPKVWS